MAEQVQTYNLVNSKDLLALGRQLDFVDCRLPSVRVPADFGLQSPSDNLMAEADADNADIGLGQDFGRVIDEFVDPRCIGK